MVADLFGSNAPASDQFSLFGDEPGRMPHADEDFRPDPAQVRERLNAILAVARAAPASPWPEKKQRVWQIVFPNMAKWLPDDERDQLCFEFSQEIERLKLAA